MMKPKNFLSLIVLILLAQAFSSCSAYKSSMIPLEESVDRGRVKLISVKGDEFRFEKIILEDDVYYGLKLGKKYKLTQGNDY